MSVLDRKRGSLEGRNSFLRSRLFLVLSCGVVAILSFWSTVVLLHQFSPRSWRDFQSRWAPVTTQTKLDELPALSDKGLSWLGIAGINAAPVTRIAGVTSGLRPLRITALEEGIHTLAFRVTGLVKNERNRITAWVRPVAGANFGIAARDQADRANGPNNARAFFDLTNQKVLLNAGNGKPGIDEVGDWLTVWLELLTTDGKYVVNLYVCNGVTESYAADGRLGVILGGISAN
jgi:hypothetical protein